jgi:hypothetical protein
VLERDVAGVIDCYESSPGVGAALLEFPVADATEA